MKIKFIVAALLLMPFAAFAAGLPKYPIPDALDVLRPGASWTIRGADCAGLEWHDKNQAQPSCDEIAAEVKRQAARPDVPDITKRQALSWLLSAGKAEQDVIDAINSISDEKARAQALIDWQYPDKPFKRSNPMFDQLAPVFGMTSQQLDAAFAAASKL